MSKKRSRTSSARRMAEKDLLPREAPTAFRDVGPGGRYRVGPPIAGGLMGAVSVAYDRETQSLVALKILKPDPRIQHLEARFQTFRNDFEALRNLRHTNLLRVHDIGQDGDSTFFTSELVIGRDIVHHAWDPSVGLQECCDLIVQLLMGLHSIHSRGWIHGDIKPENVLVHLKPAKDGKPEANIVKILDFGFSLKTPGPWLAGTPEFMPPELLPEFFKKRQPPSLDQEAWFERGRKADLYAVGCIIYIILTARWPTGKEMLYESEKPSRDELLGGEPPRSVSRWNTEVPASLEGIVMRLLGPESERPSTAREVATQIQERVAPDVPMEHTDSLAVMRNPYLDASESLSKVRWMLEEGKSGIVVVRGHPGWGKSRLLEEVAVEFGPRGVNVIAGAYTESGGLERFAEALSQSLYSFFSDVMEGEGLDPDDPARHLQNRIEAELRARLEDNPCAILVDDAQWGDVTVLAALRGAVARLCDTPEATARPVILVVTLAADEDHGDQPGLPREHPIAEVFATDRDNRMQALSLQLFERHDIERWLQAIGSWDNLEDVAQLLEEEAGGIPSAMDAYLRQLVEDKALRTIGGRWRVSTKKLTEFKQREGDVNVWPQLDKLTIEQSNVLSTLAVFDREVRVKELLAVCPLPAEEVDVALDDLVMKLGLVRRGHKTNMYRIPQGRLRKIVYERIKPKSRLQDLHRNIATMIEREYKEVLDRHYAAVAFHWVRAGDRKQGARYSLLAAKTLLKNHQYDQAEQPLLDAIDIYSSSKAKNEQALAIEAQLDLARVYIAARQVERSDQTLEAARKAAEKLKDPVLLAKHAAMVAENRRQQWRHTRMEADTIAPGLEEETLSLLRHHLEQVKHLRSKEVGALRANLLDELAAIYALRRQPEEAAEVLEQSRALAEKLKLPTLARTLSSLARNLIHSQQGKLVTEPGKSPKAVEIAETAVKVAKASGDPQDLADAYASLGVACHGTANLPAAITNYRKAIRGFEELRLDAKVAQIRMDQSALVVEMGLSAEAEKLASEALLYYGDSTGKYRYNLLVTLGKALYFQGKYSGSERFLREALSYAEERKAHDPAMTWRPAELLALNRAERGESQEAIADLSRLIEREISGRRRKKRPVPLRWLADTVMTLGCWIARQAWCEHLQQIDTSESGKKLEDLCEKVSSLEQTYLLLFRPLFVCARAYQGDHEKWQERIRPGGPTVAEDAVETARGIDSDRHLAEVAYHVGMAALVGKSYHDAHRFLATAMSALRNVQLNELFLQTNALMMFALIGQGRLEPAKAYREGFMDRCTAAMNHMTTLEERKKFLNEPFRALAFNESSSLVR